MGQDAQLLGRGQGLQARNDRHINPDGPATRDKIEVALVVEEHLGDDVRCAMVHFLLEPAEVAVGIGGLEVFLWISSHPDAEVGRRGVLDVGVEIDALVEVDNLVDEVNGVGMSICFGLESAFTADGVTAEGEDIADSDKVEVDQGILGFLQGKAATDDVGHGFDLVAVHQGGTDAHGARSLAYRPLAQQARTDFPIDVFLPVVGDIYKRRIERHEGVHGPVDGIDVLSLQRGEKLNAESAPVGIGEDVLEGHVARDSGRSRRTGESQRAAASTGCPRRAA